VTYRRRYRRSRPFARDLRRWWRRRTSWQKLAIIVIGAVVLLGAGHGAQRAAGTASPASAAVASASGSSSAQWAVAFLQGIPEPVTSCNLGAIEAWEQAEGGGVTNDASYNPLDTTQQEPGSWGINGDNVQAYPSWSEGLNANVTAITNGLYGGILSALQAGNSAQAVADSVTASPWGTGVFSASC
jgi:hypothetical protein